MNRKEAILELKTGYPKDDTPTEECVRYEEAVDMAIDALKEQRPHGEWITTSNIWADDVLNAWGHYKKCSCCNNQEQLKTPFCPNCGASMSANCEQITGKLNSEIENSDLPERFTATDCSCLNCKNRHSVHCEPQNKKIYGYCGNWERR